MRQIIEPLNKKLFGKAVCREALSQDILMEQQGALAPCYFSF
jgi:hypothetical protein